MNGTSRQDWTRLLLLKKSVTSLECSCRKLSNFIVFGFITSDLEKVEKRLSGALCILSRSGLSQAHIGSDCLSDDLDFQDLRIPRTGTKYVANET